MKTKEEIVHSMCMTYRHDYGLRKQSGEPTWTTGMTEEDAKMLYKTMEQIYDNDIAPIILHYERIENGDSVVLPKDREHAEAMAKIGLFYLENQDAVKRSK